MVAPDIPRTHRSTAPKLVPMEKLLAKVQCVDISNLGLRQAPTIPLPFVATELVIEDTEGSTFLRHAQQAYGFKVPSTEQCTFVPTESSEATLYLLFTQMVSLSVPLPRSLLHSISEPGFIGLQALEPIPHSRSTKLKPIVRSPLVRQRKLVPLNYRPTVKDSCVVDVLLIALLPWQLQRLQLKEKPLASPLVKIAS